MKDMKPIVALVVAGIMAGLFFLGGGKLGGAAATPTSQSVQVAEPAQSAGSGHQIDMQRASGFKNGSWHRMAKDTIGCAVGSLPTRRLIPDCVELPKGTPVYRVVIDADHGMLFLFTTAGWQFYASRESYTVDYKKIECHAYPVMMHLYVECDD